MGACRQLLVVALMAAPASASGNNTDRIRIDDRSAAPAAFTITATSFKTSRFPFNQSFFGTTPDPDKAGLGCAEDANKGDSCFFPSDDPWLKATLPVWKPAAGAVTTRPWTNGFSAPRLLGGIADHDPSNNTYIPNLEFEVVSRGRHRHCRCC